MMKMKLIKRILCLLPVLVMVFFLLPANAFAAEVASGTCGTDLTWVLEDTGTLTISGTGKMTIGESAPWTQYVEQITSVVIEDGATSISISAFSGCSSMTELVLPDSLRSIGSYAFYWCSGLTSVTLPDGVTSIGNYAFSDCTALTEVILPESVTSIGDGAFYDCTSLTSFTVPAQTQSVGAAAFVGTGLTAIAVEPGNTAYMAIDGVLFTADGRTLVAYPTAKEGSYTVPDTVTTIEEYAFRGADRLTAVVIPDSVTTIGSYAFTDCSGLTSVRLPSGLTVIDTCVFHGCSSLNAIEIPDTVTSIRSYAFSNCNALTSVTIPNSVTDIYTCAFANCIGLTKVTFDHGSQIANIRKSAFVGCTALTHIYTNSTKEAWAEVTIGSQAIPGTATIVYGITTPHSYSAQWSHDGTHHWHECACGARADETAHIPGAEATCTIAQVCTDCGAEVTPATGHSDSGNGYCGGVDCGICMHGKDDEGRCTVSGCRHPYKGDDACCPRDVVCWNMDTGMYYGDVADALAEAGSGETVQMLENATAAANGKNEQFIAVNEGVTFDLNGCYVETRFMNASGNVVDNASGADGGLVSQFNASTKYITLNSRNAHLPLYDAAAGCYRFYQYQFRYYTYRTGTDTVTYGYTIDFEKLSAYQLLSTYGADTGLNVNHYTHWTALGDNEMGFSYTSDTVRKFGTTGLTAIPAGKTPVFTFNLSNLSVISGQTVDSRMVISSVTNVTAEDKASPTYQVP